MENVVCSMNIHYRYYPIDVFYNSCFENEINNVELWLCPQHFLVNDRIHFDINKVKQTLDKYNLKVACICPEQNNPKPCNMASKDELIIDYSFKYLKNVILFAEKIQCPKILLTSGWDSYDEEIESAWNRSIDHMRTIANFSKEHNVSICIEPLQPFESRLINNKNQMFKYLKDLNCENVFVAIDTGALGAANETIQEWFEMFGEKIIHTHYVDGTPTGHMPIGYGNRNINEDIEVFDYYKYKGVLSFEFANKMAFKEPNKYDLQAKRKIEEAIAKLKGENNDNV